MDRSKWDDLSSGAGAIGWVAEGNPVNGTASEFFGGVTLLGSAPLAAWTAAEQAQIFSVRPTGDGQQALVFPQSVASGDPRPHGIVLWTRIDPAHSSASSVGWQIASSSDFAVGSVLLEGFAAPQAAHDSTVKIAVSHASLQPFTVYFYRFVAEGVASRTGRFKTLPARDAELSQLRLAQVVCQDFGNGYYNALAYLAQEEVDYVVHLGDYIYETIASPAFQKKPVRVVPPFASGGLVPVDVNDYRHLYKVYKSDPHQQAVHERFAYIQLWDDHEFANDCHGDFHPDDNIAPNTAATPQPSLRQAANQAWSEYGLMHAPFDPAQDWEHSIQLYRTYSFGSLAELIVTDERLYRDGPPCGSNENFERYYSLGCPAMHDGDRSMLGETQRAWFLEQLTTTKATWKLWANEVMLMQLKAGPVYIDLDQWDGYQAERNLILNTVKHQKIENFVALTGDLHTFVAGYLKTDFENPFEEHVGVELVVGSLTSTNFSEEIRNALPSVSRPAPAKQMGVTADRLEPVVRAANPWIQYWDSATHGYAILTLTPESLRCEFKAVSTITEPSATLVSLRTLTVPAGKVELHQA